MSEEGKKVEDVDAPADPGDAEEPREPSQALDPKEAFVQGMGLLWQAARGAVGGIKKELEKADIPGELRTAADEMKRAAEAAIAGKTREPEPDWVQPDQAGPRIQTDDEPPADEGKPPEQGEPTEAKEEPKDDSKPDAGE